MKIRQSGPLLISFVLLITLSLYLLSKNDPSLIIAYPLKTLAQIFGLLGISLLCFSYFLSSRLSYIEPLFGGLDKVYKYHHLTGGISFLLLIHHPIFLLINSLPNYKTALIYILPSKLLPYNLGIFALYLMILLLFITFFTKLPYHIWKRSHEFMGLVIILGGLHSVLVDSDVSAFFPLRVWIIFISFIAIACFTYKRLLYRQLGPRYDYQLTEINYRQSETLDLVFAPIGKSLHFTPGQFAFISFPNISFLKEFHPYTFSSDPSSPYLRFSIKALGDYTKKLNTLKPGALAHIMGPYGEFHYKFASAHSVICIAGGIGITPFLSMLSIPQTKPTTLFYCVSRSEEAIYDADLTELAMKNNFTYHLYIPQNHQRISADYINNITPVTTQTSVFLCGPLPMMESLRKQFLKIQVKSTNIIFEDFSLR